MPKGKGGYMAGIEGGSGNSETGGTWARGNEAGQHRMAVQGLADQVKGQATAEGKTVFEVFAEYNLDYASKFEILAILLEDVSEVVHKGNGRRIPKGEIKKFGFNDLRVQVILKDGTIFVDRIDQFLLQ